MAVFAAVTTATPLASAAVVDSSGAAACEDGSSAARVMKGSTAQEPALYPKNEAKKYGVIKDSPRMPDGSVSIDTVFHVITAATPTPAEKAHLESMIADQMTVLNDSYSGVTAPDAAGSPFRFALRHWMMLEHTFLSGCSANGDGVADIPREVIQTARSAPTPAAPLAWTRSTTSWTTPRTPA